MKGYNEGGKLPQEMVDEQKRKGYESDPFVKMRDKIFGPEKPKEKPQEPVKKAKGGMVGSASKRADGCAIKGKTKGRMV